MTRPRSTLSRAGPVLSRRALCGQVMATLALPAALVAAPATARAIIDPRSVTPMSLHIGDWLTLSQDDRKVFLVGFSIGWNHAAPPPEAAALTDAPAKDADGKAAAKSGGAGADKSGDSADAAQNDGEGADADKAAAEKAAADAASETAETLAKALDALDIELIRLANSAGSADIMLVTALTRAALLERLPVLRTTGREWRELPMRHRTLMLQSLVAGAHCEAVWQALGRPQDSQSLNRGMRRARAIARPPYPVNPNVITTRLMAFYSHEDRLDTPLLDAVAAVGRRPNLASRD